MRLEVTVKGAERAADGLDAMAARARDARPVLARSGRVLRESTKQRFQTGRGWRRLAASTREKDRQEGRDPRPLRLTGALEASLTELGGPGAVLDVSSDELRYGTTVHYARFHHAGTGVPRRRLIQPTRNDRVRITEMIRDHLLRGSD